MHTEMLPAPTGPAPPPPGRISSECCLVLVSNNYPYKPCIAKSRDCGQLLRGPLATLGAHHVVLIWYPDLDTPLPHALQKISPALHHPSEPPLSRAWHPETTVHHHQHTATRTPNNQGSAGCKCEGTHTKWTNRGWRNKNKLMFLNTHCYTHKATEDLPLMEWYAALHYLKTW